MTRVKKACYSTAYNVILSASNRRLQNSLLLRGDRKTDNKKVAEKHCTTSPTCIHYRDQKKIDVRSTFW